MNANSANRMQQEQSEKNQKGPKMSSKEVAHRNTQGDGNSKASTQTASHHELQCGNQVSVAHGESPASDITDPGTGYFQDQRVLEVIIGTERNRNISCYLCI